MAENKGPGAYLSPGAAALRDHQRTTGMAVTMGWTCKCGKYCNDLIEQWEHQAAMVAAALPEDNGWSL